ncbi:hypothetical protein STAQ_34320 [Allostella sp. ATCC 35155]|nr:hypothetical protein STAQ_34320 [Stella sp. ATCC 35155]
MAILDTGGMDLSRDRQAAGIDRNLAPAAHDHLKPSCGIDCAYIAARSAAISLPAPGSDRATWKKALIERRIHSLLRQAT